MPHQRSMHAMLLCNRLYRSAPALCMDGRLGPIRQDATPQLKTIQDTGLCAPDETSKNWPIIAPLTYRCQRIGLQGSANLPVSFARAPRPAASPARAVQSAADPQCVTRAARSARSTRRTWHNRLAGLTRSDAIMPPQTPLPGCKLHASPIITQQPVRCSTFLAILPMSLQTGP